ncbi:MAG: cell division protein FtsB [Gammaproteobacteria bacterium]|nr:cell division protein FtsB [Gammaproteobacteria bacterium]
MRGLIVALSLLLVVLQYPLWFGDNSMPAAWRLQEKIVQQKAENSNLVERNQILESEVNDLKTGVAVLEEKARNELGMIKPNETYYQIVEPSTEE